MCKKRSEEEILIERGPEEEVIEVETADGNDQGAISIAGILVLAILLLLTFATGGYVIIRSCVGLQYIYSDTLHSSSYVLAFNNNNDDDDDDNKNNNKKLTSHGSVDGESPRVRFALDEEYECLRAIRRRAERAYRRSGKLEDYKMAQKVHFAQTLTEIRYTVMARILHVIVPVHSSSKDMDHCKIL
ncbi:hypothetical protein HPB50_016242 [Hyalomma asiaticum]|uniref:Uncharacterized protein n=1 Tax=Hyalomma asiaticum TaxID=266040 RepID=A0ACB7TLD0_HYAAI|nr:hypothetical protein HPB50_016242 [Hyalomma asiaticum]